MTVSEEMRFVFSCRVYALLLHICRFYTQLCMASICHTKYWDERNPIQHLSGLCRFCTRTLTHNTLTQLSVASICHTGGSLGRKKHPVAASLFLASLSRLSLVSADSRPAYINIVFVWLQ